MRVFPGAAICLVLAFGASCQTKVMTGGETGRSGDGSGGWAGEDARLVAETLVADCLNDPWLSRHLRDVSRSPVITVGTIDNRTGESIIMSPLISDIERALVNSAQVEVVGWGADRVESESQGAPREYVRREAVRNLARDLGAEYVIDGSISSLIISPGDGTDLPCYQLDLTLTDLMTNRDVWTGSRKIRMR
jgi:hypothetical protein